MNGINETRTAAQGGYLHGELYTRRTGGIRIILEGPDEYGCIVASTDFCTAYGAGDTDAEAINDFKRSLEHDFRHLLMCRERGMLGPELLKELASMEKHLRLMEPVK